jgi:hypothetical protein
VLQDTTTHTCGRTRADVRDTAFPLCLACGAALKKRGFLHTCKPGDGNQLHHCRRSRCD